MKQVIVLFVLLALALMPTDRAVAQAPTTTLAAELLVSTLGAETVQNFENRPDGLTLVGQRGSLVSAPLGAGWEFIALGVTWDEALPEGMEVALDARVSADGQRWEPWQPLGLMEMDGPDGFVTRNSDLLFAQGRFAQLRLSATQSGDAPFTWRGLKVTFIDGRPGPDVAPPADANPDEPNDEPPAVVTRAGWGANEAYRFNANGQEIWPRIYWPLRAFFFHHTASSPTATPSAAVRSIYYYHAVTLGWGDIGYHYLVDQFGTIYQGRYGTESGGQVVEAGHTLGYNRHTMGVSMIGNFTSVAPPAAQLAAAKELLAWRSFTYGINPYASVWLDGVGDISPDRWFDDSLLGHRDSHTPARTTCPGDAAYAKMGEIRSYVSQRMNQLAPVVQLVAPATGSTLAGNVTLQASASPNVVRVEYELDGAVIAVSNGAPWTVTVDAASLPAGGRTLRAVGFTADNRSASDQRAVTVALASSPPITPTAEPTRTPTITPSPTATHTPTATPTITPSPTLPPGTTATPAPSLTEWLFLPMMSRETLPPPPPPPPPPLPPRCEGMLDNSDFHVNDGWSTLLGDVAARYATEQKWDGQRSLRAGMEPGNPYRSASWSSARRAVTLPNDGRTVTLTMRYLRQSDNVAAGGDVQYLGILNSAGAYTASVIPSGLAHDAQWKSVSYDLAPFRGQSIYLYVGAMNNGDSSGTRIYVDDVQITLCGD